MYDLVRKTTILSTDDTIDRVSSVELIFSAAMFDLHCAACLGEYDGLRTSLFGENVNKINKEGWTPLMYACACQRVKIVELLMINGASAKIPGSNGLTPLMIASRNGEMKVLELLLKFLREVETPEACKLALNARDSEGWSSLFHAVYMGQEETVCFLLKNGADANIVDAHGRSLITMAMNVWNKKGSSLVRVLMESCLGCHSPRREAAFVAEKFDYLPDLRTVLFVLDVEKYWKYFNEHNIRINDFLMLSEEDLKNIGVRLLGPRRKMTAAITQLRNKFHVMQ